MAGGTAANLVRSAATVYFGAGGTTTFSTSTFTSVGYTTGGGVKYTRTLSGNKLTVDQETIALDFDVTDQTHQISWTFAELTPRNLLKAMGSTSTATATTADLTTEPGWNAIAFVTAGGPIGTATAASTRTFLFPDCKPISDLSMTIGEKGVLHSIAASFEYFIRRTNKASMSDA